MDHKKRGKKKTRNQKATSSLVGANLNLLRELVSIPKIADKGRRYNIEHFGEGLVGLYESVVSQLVSP